MIGRYVNDEMEKDVEGSGRGLIVRYYQTSAWRETEEKHKKLIHDNRSLVRDLNPGPPEYKAEVLIAQP
jgi:hypothetical protein